MAKIKRMLPKELERLLKNLGLTQVRAANILGVDARTMRKWLSNQARIPHATAQYLRTIVKFKIPLHELP